MDRAGQSREKQCGLEGRLMTFKNSGPDGLALIPPLSAPSLGAVTQTQPLSNLHSETHVHLDAESYSQVFTNTDTHASLPHTNTL